MYFSISLDVLQCNWSVACINWVSRLTLLLPPLPFRILRTAIYYILKYCLQYMTLSAWMIRYELYLFSYACISEVYLHLQWLNYRVTYTYLSNRTRLSWIYGCKLRIRKQTQFITKQCSANPPSFPAWTKFVAVDDKFSANIVSFYKFYYIYVVLIAWLLVRANTVN